jgi:hypothetical protein
MSWSFDVSLKKNGDHGYIWLTRKQAEEMMRTVAPKHCNAETRLCPGHRYLHDLARMAVKQNQELFKDSR